jgi:endonuclease/exonuclease/phosphatase (EEP) superfamily protein YafD
MDKLRESLARLARILVALTACAALVGYTGSWYWLAELFSHFFIQYWAACLLAGAVLLWAGDKRWSAASAALFCLLSFAVVPYYFRTDALAASPANTPLKLFQFNAAQNPARVFDWLEQNSSQIDVVVLLEASPAFQSGIDQLRTRFPYTLTQLQDGPFGIALLSKYPLAGAEVLDLAGEKFPALAARITIPGWAAPLQIYAVHPPPPLGGELAGIRNQYMEELAARISTGKSAPTIVVGDINSTPWSPWFRDFMRATKLRDSQDESGLLATWPAATAQYSSLFGIPIDACLHSGNVQAAARSRGPYLDSDHLPVITELQLR